MTAFSVHSSTARTLRYLPMSISFLEAWFYPLSCLTPDEYAQTIDDLTYSCCSLCILWTANPFPCAPSYIKCMSASLLYAALISDLYRLGLCGITAHTILFEIWSPLSAFTLLTDSFETICMSIKLAYILMLMVNKLFKPKYD